MAKWKMRPSRVSEISPKKKISFLSVVPLYEEEMNFYKQNNLIIFRFLDQKFHNKHEHFFLIQNQ